MFTIIQQIVTGLVSGVFAPLMSYLGKRQDNELTGFQTAAGIDGAAYGAWLNYQLAITQAKAAANGWWGARALYLVVGATAAAHTAAVFLDSTLKLGCGHYGCLGVPMLPAAYADYERVVVYSLFVVSTIGPPASAAAAWLHRR